jgi:hypothetical protein
VSSPAAHGKVGPGVEPAGEIKGGFSEGLDTADPVEAKRLLEEMGTAAPAVA